MTAGRMELNKPVQLARDVCNRAYVQMGVSRYSTPQQAVKILFVRMKRGFDSAFSTP